MALTNLTHILKPFLNALETNTQSHNYEKTNYIRPRNNVALSATDKTSSG
jgi:hypothetical protein